MTSTPSEATSSKPGPRAALAGVMIGLLVLGGSFWAYSNTTPRPANANDFRPDPGARGGRFVMGGGNAPMIQRPRDPVTVGPRVVTIRDCAMPISSMLRGDSKWNLNITFSGESLGGTPQQQLTMAVRRVVDSKQPPASYKLTDQQRAALAAIPLTPCELTDAQLNALTGLLEQSQKLKADSPEMPALKNSMQDLAAEIKAVDQAQAKARYAARDAKFREILSGEQIDVLLGTRNARANNVPAGAAPAAK